MSNDKPHAHQILDEFRKPAMKITLEPGLGKTLPPDPRPATYLLLGFAPRCGIRLRTMPKERSLEFAGQPSNDAFIKRVRTIAKFYPYQDVSILIPELSRVNLNGDKFNLYAALDAVSTKRDYHIFLNWKHPDYDGLNLDHPSHHFGPNSHVHFSRHLTLVDRFNRELVF